MIHDAPARANRSDAVDDPKKCPYCGGTGYVYSDEAGGEQMCSYCLGTGVEESEAEKEKPPRRAV